MKKKVLVLTYTKLRMIDEKIDDDNYVPFSKWRNSPNWAMHGGLDGRFLDTVILTKTNLPRTNLPFS